MTAAADILTGLLIASVWTAALMAFLIHINRETTDE